LLIRKHRSIHDTPQITAENPLHTAKCQQNLGLAPISGDFFT
jgi:hypothetical protein